MKKKQTMKTLAVALLMIIGVVSVHAQRVMENLDRGIVAIPTQDGKVYVGWRLLATDPDDIAFNLYRVENKGTAIKLNTTPITQTTDFVDAKAKLNVSNVWYVRPVTRGNEGVSSESFSLKPNAPKQNYLSIPMQIPESRELLGKQYTYDVNDCSVGDLDGDGQYEVVVKWTPSNSTLPPRPGMTGNTLYDAYKMDGTLMWRIDCGVNIRSGDAYNQFLVYDLDGDGKAELTFKTGDGTLDGLGKPIGDLKADWRTKEASSPTYGKILNGPEYLTVFEGATGKALATEEYIPTRYPLDGWGGVGGNGGNDVTGGRPDRMTACVAYLDGHLPSVVMVRGWYGRSVLAAWDFRNGKLTKRWVFDSENAKNPYSGQGNHSVTVADFDENGFDEVCIGAMTVDHNGKGLYTTGLRHGDALHASDLNPNRPGLEVFGVHENEATTVQFNTPGSAMFDGKTGEILWSNNPTVDVGRGVAADIDPNFPGAECWGAPGGTRRGDTGEVIYPETPNSVNFAIWWDADPLRELLDKTTISKWNWKERKTEVLFNANAEELPNSTKVTSNNGTKSTPALSGDLFGDWREEVMFRTSDNKELRIYTTTIPAAFRMNTLMHDSQYRLAICWQNVAYNQPPHPSFFIGQDMKPAPRSKITAPR